MNQSRPLLLTFEGPEHGFGGKNCQNMSQGEQKQLIRLRRWAVDLGHHCSHYGKRSHFSCRTSHNSYIRNRCSCTQVVRHHANMKWLSSILLCMLGKKCCIWQFEIFFLFFPEIRLWHFMQIVSKGDNLHEMSKPTFWEKYCQFVICWICQEHAKWNILVTQLTILQKWMKTSCLHTNSRHYQLSGFQVRPFHQIYIGIIYMYILGMKIC